MRTSLKINPVVRDETCHILVASLGLSDEQAATVYRTKVASAEPAKSGIKFSAAEDGTPEIAIYEEIGLDWWTGEGMTAKKFRDELLAFGDVEKFRMRLNSPGGDAFDGLTIYNLAREHKAHVEVRVDGLAASAASIIAMAGDDVVMSEGALMMIHRAWTIGIGNTNDMLKVAEVLEKLDGQIAGTYARKSGRKSETFLRLMDDETWLNPEEAVKERLADRVAEGVKANTYDLSRFRNAPQAVETEETEEAVVVDREEVLARLAELTEDHLAA